MRPSVEVRRAADTLLQIDSPWVIRTPIRVAFGECRSRTPKRMRIDG